MSLRRRLELQIESNMIHARRYCAMCVINDTATINETEKGETVFHLTVDIVAGEFRRILRPCNSQHFRLQAKKAEQRLATIDAAILQKHIARHF